MSISVNWQRRKWTARRILKKNVSLRLLVFPLFLFPCPQSSRRSQPFSYWPGRGVSHTQTSKSAQWQLSPTLSGPKERENNLCLGQEERREDICPCALFCMPELRFNSTAFFKWLANRLLCSNWPWWSSGPLIWKWCKRWELITWLIMLEPVLSLASVFKADVNLRLRLRRHIDRLMSFNVHSWSAIFCTTSFVIHLLFLLMFFCGFFFLIPGTIILFLRSSMCSCL